MPGNAGRGAALLFGLLLAAAGAAPAAAQSLQQQNDQILNELKAIRQLLEKLAGPLGQPGAQQAGVPSADAEVKLAGPITGYILGKPDAPLTMVEFTDLQCPFCRQFRTGAFEQLKKDYIDTGTLRYISRDFPLDQLHPLAATAARAARCAGEQGRFWEMRHAILLNNSQLKDAMFTTLASELKLDAAVFASCLAAAGRFDADLRKDQADAASVGISGTPSFVVGRTTASDLEGVLIVGAQPFAAFDARLKNLLSK